MAIRFLLVLLALLFIPSTQPCVLCPLRIPPFPKPLDQFRIPSIQKLLETSDVVVSLCQNETRDMVDSFKTECPGPDQVEQCTSCRSERARRTQRRMDSLGKMPAGIGDGNYHWLGDYQQCRDLHRAGSFDGRYCLVDFTVPDSVSSLECEHNDPLEVSLGACLPSSCGVDENKYLVEYVTELDVQIRCEPRDQWSFLASAYLLVLVGWALILCMATLAEWLFPKQQSLKSVVQALSLQRNARESLRTNRPPDQQFHALQGIQVISVIFLVSGNVFFLMLPYLENVSYAYDLSDRFFYQPIVNYSFFIDGLLALAAICLVARPSADFETFQKVALLLFRKLIRVWPAYLGSILFISLIYVRLGEGPMWSHNDLPKRCADNWWSNVLLINNLLGVDKTCLDGSFLFALKGQLLVFGLFVLFMEHKVGRRSVMWTLLTALVMSMVYTFVLTYDRNLEMTLIPTKNLKRIHLYKEFAERIYMNPLSRSGPYVLAMLLTLLYKETSRSTFSQMRGSVVFCLYILGTVVVVWAPFYLSGTHGAIMTAVYSSLHRNLWAFVVVCAVFTLNHVPKGNTVNAILGWRAFHPLSKLAYMVFLISEPVSVSLFASLHRPIYATSLSTILTCIGSVCVSYALAFVIDITVSRPVRHLLALCLRPAASDADKR